VAARQFPSRSRAIELAIAEQLERLEHRRLARESAKLDATAERALADEGLSGDAASWPAY